MKELSFYYESRNILKIWIRITLFLMENVMTVLILPTNNIEKKRFLEIELKPESTGTKVSVIPIMAEFGDEREELIFRAQHFFLRT